MFITASAPGLGYIVEAEPNDSINTAQNINLPSAGGEITVRGIPSFGVDGNLDFYRVTVAAGTYVNFDIDNGESVNDSFDSYLVLLDENGALVATQDDVLAEDPGTLNTHDSMLFYYFDQAGTYYIVVSLCCDATVLDGVTGHIGDYELVITDWAPSHNIMTEVEPNDTFGAPQDIDIPATGQIIIGGLPSIGVDGNLDFYRFAAQAGQTILFDLDFAEDDGNSDSFDSYLVLLDSDGNVITTADDFYPVDTGSELSDDVDSTLYYEFTTTGTYYIVVAECCDSTVLDGVTGHIGDYIFYISSVTPPGTPPVAAETEPNDTIFSSRDISIPFNGQVTVQGEPSATDGNLDFYRFNIAAPMTVVFDIDEGIGGADGFDSYLVLLDASGNILYINDDTDVDLDSGSVSFNDSFMFFDFDIPGDYYLAVSACCDDMVLEGTVANHIGDYKLVITSVSSSAVEIPTLSEWGMIIMVLLMGVFAVYYIRRRRRYAA